MFKRGGLPGGGGGISSSSLSDADLCSIICMRIRLRRFGLKGSTVCYEWKTK